MVNAASCRITRVSRARCLCRPRTQNETLLIENGDVVAAIDDKGARIAGQGAGWPRADRSARAGEIGDEVLRDRRHLAEDGLVVPVVAINKQTGALEGRRRSSRAASSWKTAKHCWPTESACWSEAVDQASVEERTDQGIIKGKAARRVARFLRKRSGRRPFVLPVIMEFEIVKDRAFRVR